MRILFLCNSRYWGGAEAYVAFVAGQLAARGHRCWLAAPEGSPLSQLAAQQGVGVVPLDIGPKLGTRTTLEFLLRQRRHRLRLAALLQECVATHGIEALHLQFKKEQLLGSSEAVRLGLPVVWTEHGRLPRALIRAPVAIWAYRRASRCAHRIICVSDAVRTHLAGHGLPQDRLLVCHNGVELPPAANARERARLRASLGLPDDALVIGATSRLSRIKGVRHLIEALPSVFARFQSARALIMGDGPERAMLEARARQLGCMERVLFAGHRADARELLATLDVHVTPSLSDGLSYAVLEAMAAGVPVLATRVGGNPEAVAEAGLLIEAGSAKAVAAGVNALLAEPTRRAWLGERGRERVASVFGTRRMIDVTESVFRTAVRQQPSRDRAAEAA